MTKNNDPKLQRLIEALFSAKVEYNELAAQRSPNLCLEDDTVLTKKMWAADDNVKKREKELHDHKQSESK